MKPCDAWTVLTDYWDAGLTTKLSHVKKGNLAYRTLVLAYFLQNDLLIADQISEVIDGHGDRGGWASVAKAGKEPLGAGKLVVP